MNCGAPYLLTLVVTFLLASPGVASNGDDLKRSSNATTEGVEYREEKWERDSVVFTAQDRETIRKYYRIARSTHTVRQAKDYMHHLPSHLQRNRVLPLGLQNQLQALSNDLEQRLQPLYSGYVRGMIGQDMVIVETRTLRVMDVIRDVTGHR